MTIHLNLTLTDLIGVALLALFIAFGFIVLLPLVAERLKAHKVKATTGVMIVLAIAATTLLLGCGPTPTKNMEIDTSNSTVSIRRIAVFEDDLSYGGKRGIYIIKDHATNKEFIGVSGIGISDIGQHPVSSGKVTVMVRDER